MTWLPRSPGSTLVLRLNQETVHDFILLTMRPALDPAGHRVPRTKPTCLLHTWRPHRRRPFALVLHLHQHQSSRNLHLQYLTKNQSTQRCQSLITPVSDHPPVLESHMVLKKDILKLDDGQYYEAHYTCCTLNIRRQNSRKGPTRIQLAPCCKTNLSKDWSSYWFYVKVDMSKILGYTRPAYPLYSPIEPGTATCTALYNNRAVGFKNCENDFF
jgi:hypothetical protein